MESDNSITTQSCYDTFVMTGDMIIKTTAKKPALAGLQMRPLDAAGKLALPALVDNICALDGHSGEDDNVVYNAVPKLNGRVKAIVSDDSTVIQQPLHSTVCVNESDSSRVELDIPPDDISSEDEQQVAHSAAVDIDVDQLPPPPDEFLFHSSSAGEVKLSKPEHFLSPVAVDCNSACDVSQTTTGADGVVADMHSAGCWRNSLDEAIARLENELPSEMRTMGAYNVDGVSALACSSSSAETLSASKTSSVGVRSSKSQENCLHLENDGKGTVLFDIDVDEGNSASVEVLHSDALTASQANSTASPTKKPKKRTAVTNFGSGTDSPWWDGAAAATSDDKTLSNEVITDSDKETGQMQPCYLVCPKSVNLIANIGNLSTVVTSSSRMRSTVTNDSVMNVESEQVGDSDRPSGLEIGRPLQVKEVDRPSACRLAKRLYYLDGFQKADVAKHLCKLNEFSHLVGMEYVRYFNFTGLPLDAAMRVFMAQLVLSGETQERERILFHFARRYTECNPGVYNSADACHTLTCAIILLNMDLQGLNVGHKMTLAEFVDSLSELNDGENFPHELLSNIYRSLQNEPIEVKFNSNDDDGSASTSNPNPTPVNQSEKFTLGSGINPFLSIPDPSKTVEYRKGFVMRKCCTGPDGRKTGFMRRGWKMWYAAVCDMIIYLHKDEHSYKSSTMTNSLGGNVIHIHHALATRATDYTKKQHVFALQTADWSQYLFQTSNSDECQQWIDAINFAAASLSSPPLAAGVGSQKKFQRPLLPSAYTRLNKKDQLVQHQKYLERIEMDLAEHVKYPPERGAKARAIQDYIEKETYLQFEQRRFKTYCLLLHSRMYSPTSVEPSFNSQSQSTVVDETDESLTNSQSTSVVQRTAAADRYSYHAAIAASHGNANV